VLRWTDNSDNESCFAIERKAGASGWEWLSAVGANQVGTYGDGLVSEGEHCYRVYAGNDAGRSDYSNETCIQLAAPTPSPTPPPSTPTPAATPSPSTPTPSPFVAPVRGLPATGRIGAPASSPASSVAWGVLAGAGVFLSVIAVLAFVRTARRQ
jgi:hypothetical protein